MRISIWRHVSITEGMSRFGGVDVDKMWGPAQFGRWKWRDPDVHVQLLIDNNTRMWIFSPSTTTCSDPAAMIGYCALAQSSNKILFSHFRSTFGKNATFNFPVDGQHDWSTWGPELAAMSDDIAATLR